MTLNTFTFDGRNLKSLSDPGFADKYYSSVSDVNRGRNIAGNFTASEAYRYVSHVFHCVDVRATELSRIPRGLYKDGTEVTDDPLYKSLLDIGDFLYRIETSRCLFGRGEGAPTANAGGFNPKLQWLASPSLIPRYNPQTQKLAWFDRRNGVMLSRIEIENLVYVWNFNPDDENRPGPADILSALGAASVLYSMDSMIAGYFNSGGVKVTVFPVDPSTNEPDYKAFQNWLNRRVSGVQNAFRNVVMRLKGDLKPVVIGSDLKDMEVKDLSQEKKDEIAIALDIPPNVVDGSYKYATADSEYLNFIAGVMMPRLDQTLEVLNAQWFSRFGLEMKSQPEKMEIMQTAQLAQVAQITQATGKPIYTVDEGRILAGMKPLGGSAALLADALSSTARLVDANTTDINSSVSLPTSAQTGKPMPIVPSGKPRRIELGANPAHIAKSLTAWRSGALKAIRTDSLYLSNDPSIPHELRQALNRELTACKTASQVREVFERHWPKVPKEEAPAVDGALELAAAIREATAALKETAAV